MQKLGDFIKLQNGYAFKGSDLSDDKNGNPIIKIGNVTGGSFVSLDNYQTVSDIVFYKAKNNHSKPNDILIAMTGANVGKVSRVPINFPKCGINQRVGRFLIKDSCKYSSDFIYYLVSSKKSYGYFSKIADGAAQPNISGSLIESLEFPNIDAEKANRLAEILKDLDDKIQLNTQTNQTLEQIAQTIFKSWFIDFDPIHAKINAKENGENPTLAAMQAISGKNADELHRLQTEKPTQWQELMELANAFPDEIGEDGVPMGWELSTVGDNYSVVMGQSPKGETYNEEGNGVVFYQGRAEFGWRYPKIRLFTTDPKRIAKKGDILMSVRAPVGDLNVAMTECCIGRGLSALKHKSGSFSFGFYQMKNLKETFDVFNGEGTVFGSINQKDLKSIRVIKPQENIILRFDDFVINIDIQIEKNQNESFYLENIRNELLPRLLSGEI